MEIKDYLHLYIGCDVQYGYEGSIRKGELVGHDVRYGWQVFDTSRPLAPYHFVREELLKPILRKLSDMTEEELKQCVANEWGQTHTFTEHYCKKKISEISASTHGLYNFLSFYGTQHSLPYLLKQGFDLFGLIPAGLAIDKTSLKN